MPVKTGSGESDIVRIRSGSSGVGVGVNVEVGVAVFVGVAVNVGVAVFVGVAVGVEVGVDVKVGVGVAVNVGVDVNVGEGPCAASPSSTQSTSPRTVTRYDRKFISLSRHFVSIPYKPRSGSTQM